MMAASSLRPSVAREATLAKEQHQDNYNQEQPDAAAWDVAPTRAVRPRRQEADEQEDQQDDDDEAKWAFHWGLRGSEGLGALFRSGGRPGGNFGAGAAGLRQADGDRLLAVGHLLARTTAAEFAAFHLMHGAFDFLRSLCSVPGHGNAPSAHSLREHRAEGMNMP